MLESFSGFWVIGEEKKGCTFWTSVRLVRLKYKDTTLYKAKEWGKFQKENSIDSFFLVFRQLLFHIMFQNSFYRFFLRFPPQ